MLDVDCPMVIIDDGGEWNTAAPAAILITDNRQAAANTHNTKKRHKTKTDIKMKTHIQCPLGPGQPSSVRLNAVLSGCG